MSKTKAAARRSSQDSATAEEATPAADGRPAWQTIFVMARIFYAMRSRCEEALKPYGLTSMQFTLLSTLHAHAGLSSAELSRRFNVTPQTMGEMIVNLERRSLVERQQDPHNRRALKLNLTKEGYQLLRKGEEAMMGVENEMFADLPEREREALLQRLTTLHDHLVNAPE